MPYRSLGDVKSLEPQKVGELLEVKNMVHMTDTPYEVAFDDQLHYYSPLAKICFAEMRETNQQKKDPLVLEPD